ncbi:hypothetical protein ACVD55_004127 [Vibrio alginolyticus]|nr:hypothetical protein [Vibrio parahaemolyticus]ELA7389038.1 hypothetical protein [Vibrio alginolyticus]WMN90558.1 hypothetical protein NI381_09275 [Vibrio parahaemolyticus]WMO08218.1 hypothetical protein NI377_09290 [Vibrio parahaemolyticus]
MKHITLSVLLFISVNSFAQIDLDITESVNGIFVQAKENRKPVSGLEIQLANSNFHNKTYITDNNGEVFIPQTLRSNRFVKVEAIESGVPVASNLIHLLGEHSKSK